MAKVSKLKTNMIGIIGGIIGICTLVGMGYTLDKKWDQTREVEEHKILIAGNRDIIYNKIDNDQINVYQQRIWQLEDRFKNRVMPQSTKEEIREKEKLIKNLEKKIEQRGGE